MVTKLKQNNNASITRKQSTVHNITMLL